MDILLFFILIKLKRCSNIGRCERNGFGREGMEMTKLGAGGPTKGARQKFRRVQLTNASAFFFFLISIFFYLLPFDRALLPFTMNAVHNVNTPVKSHSQAVSMGFACSLLLRSSFSWSLSNPLPSVHAE
jgi:hypothetical protein